MARNLVNGEICTPFDAKFYAKFSLKFMNLHKGLGTIQVLRHQRGGWVGWPNDDV